MLTFDARVRLDSFQFEVAFQAPAGQITVIVGESGSGKSTALRLVAGLLAPDEGSIILGSSVLANTRAGTWVPPESRSVGYVSQDFALFPHLDATANVAFGLAASRVPRNAVRDRTAEALTRFGLTELAHRKPHQLSGGQQQRVALARALVLNPEVLLLDEPLASLDVSSRRTVRGELRRILDGLPCVTLFVTHHPTDALALGERIVVLESGRITQSGPRSEFVRQPRSQYVAEFLGVNWLDGELISRDSDGLATVRVADGTLSVPDPGREGRVRLLLHPHDIVLSLHAPEGSARNVLHGPVEELIPEPPNGDRIRVLLGTRPPIAAQITAHAAHELRLAPGVSVFASFKATGIEVVAG